MLASLLVRAAAELDAGPTPQAAAVVAVAGAVSFCAVFFGGGFDDAPLVWIGGLTLVFAAALAAATLVGLLPTPHLVPSAAVFLGCLFGLALWAGASTLWSVSPDRSWTYANRTLVYAAFALVGVLIARLAPRTTIAAGAALLLGLVIGWALLAKCVPALYADYGRVARLRSPVAYWNELALLCDVAVPVGLWVAAPKTRRADARVAGALLLFGATVTLLLTYSRFGAVLACAAAAAWILLDRERVESLIALALSGGAGAAVFGVALALPGITKDGQPRSVRAHDGWVFALVLAGAALLVAAAALVLARLEERRPLPAVRRARVERIAGLAALVFALAGIVATIVFAGRLWREFTNPVTSQIASTSSRYGSLNSSNRWRWWHEEWRAFTDHPAGGTGAGTFELTDRRLRRSPLVTTEPHNVPLQFLGETGIVGFLLYAGAAVAAAAAVVRARRRAAGAERAAVTALGVGLAAFLAHMVVDMDWNFVAACGPLLLVAGALVAGPQRDGGAAARRRRPLLALGALLFALAGVYSLAAPWLAQRQLATAVNATDAKRAHNYDPLSTDALIDWAAFEEGVGQLRRAEQLYRDAVALEPQSSETWYALGSFYAEHNAWKLAYDAFSKAWTYDRYGPAGIPCGALDQARHKAFGVWPSSCPRGRPRAASP
jgi:O-antigen ligase